MMKKPISNSQKPSFETQRVWDRFIRFFHWSLVFCILTNAFIFDDGDELHRYLGYYAVSLVGLRLIWGFMASSSYARFSSFFPTPLRLKKYVGSLIKGRPLHEWGHNPLGALMIFWILGLVILLGLSGWMQGLDAYWGEDWVQEWHEAMADILLCSVALHVVAVVVMGRIERTQLALSMITGVKKRQINQSIEGSSSSSFPHDDHR